MGVLDALGVRNCDGTTRYECRNCGRELTADDESCSGCGSREIAHYEF
ncbi:hypothetical protein [Natronococcus occultus]|nr:hypothetical protein [Natronococcus occultus]